MKTNPFNGKYGPALIAEIGGNHEGNFEYAKKLTRYAISTGIDYIKFQIYTGDSLVNPVVNPDRNKHFKKFELTKEQYLELAEMVKDAGIGYTASVWNEEFLEWIDPFMDIYKVGSGDMTAYPLIEKIAKTGKPLVISTGLANEEEVMDMIKFVQSINPIYKRPDHFAVLQCTTMYPIPHEDANLNVIKRFKEIIGVTVGYSDHTEGSDALKYAYAAGAQIMEFHFTDSRKGKQFRDHKVSLIPQEVIELQQELLKIKKLLGNEKKQPLPIEIENGHVTSFRKAVYLVRDIRKGEIITPEHLTILRPNKGIDSREYYSLIGKKAIIDLKKHQVLQKDYFE